MKHIFAFILLYLFVVWPFLLGAITATDFYAALIILSPLLAIPISILQEWRCSRLATVAVAKELRSLLDTNESDFKLLDYERRIEDDFVGSCGYYNSRYLSFVLIMIAKKMHIVMYQTTECEPDPILIGRIEVQGKGGRRILEVKEHRRHSWSVWIETNVGSEEVAFRY